MVYDVLQEHLKLRLMQASIIQSHNNVEQNKSERRQAHGLACDRNIHIVGFAVAVYRAFIFCVEKCRPDLHNGVAQRTSAPLLTWDHKTSAVIAHCATLHQGPHVEHHRLQFGVHFHAFHDATLHHSHEPKENGRVSKSCR